MFDPKNPTGSLKKMQASNRKARKDQLEQGTCSSILDDLKRVIKESLTPEEYSEWECKLVDVPYPGSTGYYAIIGTPPNDDGDTSCAIRNFFRNQQSLPPEQRQNYCHISCPCRRCNPSM